MARVAFLFCVVLMGCGPRSTSPTPVVEHEARHLFWAGLDWVVRPDGARQAPGPNHWSDSPEGVWVDEAGQLHLKLRKQGGRWMSVELHTALREEPMHLVVTVASPPSSLDPQAVAGVFLYKDDEHEIDIELSEWGGGHGFNTQYALAPYDRYGKHRFSVPEGATGVRHVLDWRADRVALETRIDGRIVQEWRETAPELADRSGYRLHINHWLYQGKPPRSRSSELVLRSLTIE